jgi:DeoR family glycerol-3-phosphate regulon repressor
MVVKIMKKNINEIKMNPRQKQILKVVQLQGSVSVDVLAEECRVTPQTIRRDIDKLCEQGLVQRYHGGVSTLSDLVPYEKRKHLFLEEKRSIAQLVAREIPDGSSVFLDFGSTSEEIAWALRDHKGLRIITNDLNVLPILCANPSFLVTITGGDVRGRDRGITGEMAITLIRQYRVDYVVISLAAVDLDGTLLDFDLQEVQVVQAMMENSRKVFLAADHSKFGHNGVVRVGHLADVDALFTDQNPPNEILACLVENKIALHVAEPES